MNNIPTELPKFPRIIALDKFRAISGAAEQLRSQFEAAMSPLQQLTHFSEIVRSLSSASQAARIFEPESFRAIREMNSQMTMYDGLRDTIAQISSAAQAHRAMIQNTVSMSEQFKIPSIAKMTGFDAFGESIRQHQQSTGALADMQKYLANLQLHAFGGIPTNEISKKFGWAESGLSAAQAARKSLDEHWGEFLNNTDADLDGSHLDEGAVELVAEAITHASVDQRSLEEAVQQIIAAIQKQQTPEMQLVLWMFFRKVMDWLMGGIVGVIMSQYAPIILGEPPQVAQKIVQKTARTAVGTSELLSEYRYVATDVLIIRQNPKAKSPQIARLSFGKVVRLITKEKDFALIQWTDLESGVETQGWVFARYLSKFK